MLCWVCIAVSLVLVYLAVRGAKRLLLRADADLTLLWCERMGKSTDVLRGDVVWITGASSGIGEYLAYDLAKVGCKLVLSARRQEELERVKQRCIAQGKVTEDDVMVLPFNMTACKCHQEMVVAVLKKFQKIDILVNNAGRTQRGMAIDTELKVDRDIMDLDYFSIVSLTKAVLPHMVQRKKGHVVVTSSVAGKFGAPFSAAYSGSKFALHGWFEALRVEVSLDNIEITLVCPGPTMSNIRNLAFAAKSGEVWGKGEDESTMMTTARCTKLMTVAMANKLTEVWICTDPGLSVLYLTQYAPTMAKMFAKRMGLKAIMKNREPNWQK